MAQVFSCEFREISRSTFFIKRLWWLLPYLENIFLKIACLKDLVLQSLKILIKSKKINFVKIRSNLSKMLFNIDVLENCAIFTGKHLCQSLILIKLPQLIITRLPQFETMFALTCNKTKLPQFVAEACPNTVCPF